LRIEMISESIALLDQADAPGGAVEAATVLEPFGSGTVVWGWMLNS